MSVYDLEFQDQPQGHVIHSNIYDISDLENVTIDTKIKSELCSMPKIRNVMQ